MEIQNNRKSKHEKSRLASVFCLWETVLKKDQRKTKQNKAKKSTRRC